MKKRTLVVVMIRAILTVLCFAGCSKEPMTLEKYAKDNPDVQESIDFDLSKMEGYTEELAKSDSIISALDQALGAAGETFGGICKSLEESTEITGITTTVNYTWEDEVLVTKTFTSADADAGADAAEGE